MERSFERSSFKFGSAEGKSSLVSSATPAVTDSEIDKTKAAVAIRADHLMHSLIFFIAVDEPFRCDRTSRGVTRFVKFKGVYRQSIQFGPQMQLLICAAGAAGAGGICVGINRPHPPGGRYLIPRGLRDTFPGRIGFHH